jgi:hypothetical protein
MMLEDERGAIQQNKGGMVRDEFRGKEAEALG